MFNFFSSSKTPSIPSYEDPFDLRQPLVCFSDCDFWTIADACEGTQIFGATGSGKTSGSGQTIAKAFLHSGFGGLVLTAKKDERQLWEQYCEQCGCLDNLLVISADSPYTFNFLDYELNREGSGAGLTENLVNLFYTVMEVTEKGENNSGEAYWKRATKQMLRNTIDLLTMANGTLTLMDMYELITSAPEDADDLQSEDWRNTSLCFQTIRKAEKAPKSESRQLDFEITAKYWLKEFPGLAEKTRSIIVSTFTSLADSFLRGTLRDLFCKETSIFPELCEHGAIILIDLPVKEFGQLGQYAQVLFKYIWQQSMERRNTKESPRPVFLWADEAQFFVSEYDQQFQSTARSSKACTVYLTQNLPNYLTTLGNRDVTDAFLGNLQTKIFHSNGDHVTNEWAADLFAKNWQKQHSTNQSTNKDGDWFFPQVTSRTSSVNTNESLEYNILPYEFTTLTKGGFVNDLQVEGIIFQGGRVWNATGKNYVKPIFNQQT